MFLQDYRIRPDLHDGFRVDLTFCEKPSKAKEKLKGTKWRFGTPDRPANAQTKGSTVIIDPTGDFMNTSGSTNLDVGWYIDRRTQSIIPRTITLNNVQAAAFILLHELGHRTKSFGDFDNDAGFSGALNNDKIRKACFPEIEISNLEH